MLNFDCADMMAERTLPLPTPFRETVDFLRESLAIEDEWREPSVREIFAYNEFYRASEPTVALLTAFVQATTGQEIGLLRLRKGMNVCIGSYLPPRGGPAILERLQSLLERGRMLSPYELYVEYEQLHPFCDGNGRSGRLLYHWRKREMPLGFLRDFHYASLRSRNPK